MNLNVLKIVLKWIFFRAILCIGKNEFGDRLHNALIDCGVIEGNDMEAMMRDMMDGDHEKCKQHTCVLEQIGWEKHTYFEDGLQRFLEVTNIPTTVILDRDGVTAGRLIGFNAQLFVEMLVGSIDRTLASD